MSQTESNLTNPRLPAWLVRDLRSDHAGETGAVWIYYGVLAVSRLPDVRAFAMRHRATEQRHLDLMNGLLAEADRSRLLGLWKAMGFLTGAIPAMFGRHATFATIEAVETFVDQHYQDQIDRLAEHPALADMRSTLIDCQADERDHRDEARDLAGPNVHPLLRFWCALVGWGSTHAVTLARRI